METFVKLKKIWFSLNAFNINCIRIHVSVYCNCNLFTNVLFQSLSPMTVYNSINFSRLSFLAKMRNVPESYCAHEKAEGCKCGGEETHSCRPSHEANADHAESEQHEHERRPARAPVRALPARHRPRMRCEHRPVERADVGRNRVDGGFWCRVHLLCEFFVHCIVFEYMNCTCKSKNGLLCSSKSYSTYTL